MTVEDYTELFIDGYIECAIWTEQEEVKDGERLSDEARKEMRSDCADFVESNYADLQALNPEQCGHDFWLTRNRHGAGFWDRGLGEVGDRLTANSHPYGESWLYIGDDGLAYVSG